MRNKIDDEGLVIEDKYEGRDVETPEEDGDLRTPAGMGRVDNTLVIDLMSDRKKQEVLDMENATIYSSFKSQFITNVVNRMHLMNELMPSLQIYINIYSSVGESKTKSKSQLNKERMIIYSQHTSMPFNIIVIMGKMSQPTTATVFSSILIYLTHHPQ